MRLLVGTVALALLLPAVPASADERGRALESLVALQRACREAEAPGRRELYSVELPPGTWRFGPFGEVDGILPVDTRRNLRAFGGSAALIPSNLETVGVIATERRAGELSRVAPRSTLRIGFFLGFDEPWRTHCLVRPAVGVTTVRMDVAFVELVGPRGTLVAREGGDRLAAWLDDAELDAIPGRGPRGAMGSASVSGAGSVPAQWQQAIAAANRGSVAQAVGRCHAEGIARGADAEGQVVVRLRVDGASGRVREGEVELSTLGDRREADCIAGALQRLELSPGGTGLVDLSVPVRLRN